MVPRARQGQRWGQSGRGKGRATDRAGGWLGEGRRTPGSQPLCLGLIPWANSLSGRAVGNAVASEGPGGRGRGGPFAGKSALPLPGILAFPGPRPPASFKGYSGWGSDPVPLLPSDGQSGRETVLELGGGRGGQRDRQPCPQPPWLTCTLLFPVPPGLVDSDLPLVPARC